MHTRYREVFALCEHYVNAVFVEVLCVFLLWTHDVHSNVLKPRLLGDCNIECASSKTFNFFVSD